MAELKCKDGTIVKISDEIEAELRRAFRSKLPEPPAYKDFGLSTYIKTDRNWPIHISTSPAGQERKSLNRNVEDTKAFIQALQTAVEYCEQYGIGT